MDKWKVEALADHVVALVRELDLDNVILVGHSMGGSVALAAAPALKGRVRAVVGVDCLHNAEFEFPEEAAQSMTARLEDDYDAAVTAMVAQSFAGTSGTERVQETVLESARNTDPTVAAALTRSFLELDSPALFRGTGVPIRCINVALPWPTELEINRRYADFDAVVLEDATHFIMLEQPERFNAHLEEVLELLVHEP